MGKKPLSISVLSLLTIVVVGCSSTNCRRYNDLSDATKTEWVGADTDNKANALKVKIYKYDGSLQCGMGQAIAPKIMREEIKEIQVFSMKSQADGQMHIQACGTPTGQINVFEIRQIDLDQATKKGFKILAE